MAAGRGKQTGRITQSSIEQVLQRSDIVDLASGYTELSKRGAEHLGRCPFHDERTPSFWVNDTKGVYHCFGCGASGDVITFLQAKQGLDFVEAIEVLADRYRVDLEYDDGGAAAGKRVSKRRLYELSDAAANFYAAYLERSPAAADAREYLAARHVAPATIEAFRLGSSPDSGSGTLAAKAQQKGFTKQELGDARLITSDGRDFFRGRLMVPIIDRAGRTIGFGARKLSEDQFGGKYVNSADGPLFHKKRVVFLAPGLAQAAKDAGHVIVVEGYMDVIAMWQAGFRNVCAVMGTALTEEQVVELKRLAPRALFAFDPDAAGQVATLRALDQARAHDLDVRVVLLPLGEDPADVLLGPDGRARMQGLIDESVPLLHYRVSALLGSGNLEDDSDRERMYHEAVALFRSVPDGPARREQVLRFANALQLDSEQTAALVGVTGADRRMRLQRPGSTEPRFREERGLRTRAASVGSSTTAIGHEKRLLAGAQRLLELSGGSGAGVLEGTLPPEACFTLGVHRRMRELLVGTTGRTVDVAAIREDEELVKLHAELTALVERDMVGSDAATLAESVAEYARVVELQHLDRRLGHLQPALARTEPEALEEFMAIKQRRLELDPRASGRPPE